MRSQLTWWGLLLAGLTLQTSFLPHLVSDPWKPDFTRALVLWLALTGRPRGGAIYAFGAGLLVDMLGGARFGLTAFMRLMIYGAARPGRNVVESSPLVFLLGPLSVVLETVILLLFSSTVFTNTPDLLTVLLIGLRQALLEVFIVPLVFVAMELGSGYRTEWSTKFAAR